MTWLRGPLFESHWPLMTCLPPARLTAPHRADIYWETSRKGSMGHLNKNMWAASVFSSVLDPGRSKMEKSLPSTNIQAKGGHNSHRRAQTGKATMLIIINSPEGNKRLVIETARLLRRSPKFTVFNFQWHYHPAVDCCTAGMTVFNQNPKSDWVVLTLWLVSPWPTLESLWQQERLQKAVIGMGLNVGNSCYQRSVNCSVTQRTHQSNDHFSLYPLPCLFEEKSP